MRYEGKIAKIEQIIVSDPSYHKGVWCRYENDKLNMSNCDVSINIERCRDVIPAEELIKDLPSDTDISKVNDLEIKGIAFQMLISDGVPFCSLTNNGFTHSHWVKLNDFTIGMDTASVSLGINDVADRIRNETDSWQPSNCLHTLTDGEFGQVFEGKTPKSNVTCLLFISGYLDEDTGYTPEDILNYLKTNFSIEDLHPVESAQQTENELEIGGI